MAFFLLIVMALLLIVALERNHRRQSPDRSRLHGSDNHDDRDWGRTKLDLLALSGQAEPFAFKPLNIRRPEMSQVRHAGASPQSR